ncbi:helix-turn-helix domain-containing protein [Actinoplanes sp. NPDC049548]|uniref:helix-turn-helix domain-containing protein n=1 Tax=Actinoplanes sp. NPDC049548 TaxID=3155152 RepID=UPI00343DC270
MANIRYTRELLAEAVAASLSTADVLRYLGLRQTGGGHAHIRRRINHYGIDTSHFLGPNHPRVPPSNRRQAAEILVLRSADARREAPSRLRRALIESGREHRCATCGLGNEWNARALTLHVDHINGRFWDCRPDNLRFLCPNCHSQTETYAGRSPLRVPFVAQKAAVDGDPASRRPLTEAQRMDVMGRVERGELGASEAARQMGCSRSHIYQLQRRLRERGTIATLKRRQSPPTATEEAIVRFALEHPEMGGRRIARMLATTTEGHIDVPSHKVYYILARAGLASRKLRQASMANRADETEAPGPRRDAMPCTA